MAHTLSNCNNPTGFTSQGNEFSHYMLLASHFVLNRTRFINQYTIYPYIHSFSNIPNDNALLRPVSIPDVLPSDLPPISNFSLVAGDFEEIYGATDEGSENHAGSWNAILTCFFIDTVCHFIRTLSFFTLRISGQKYNQLPKHLP